MNIFQRKMAAVMLLLLTAALPLPGTALDLRAGQGCVHTSLQSALDAIEGVPGSHTIRIRSGNYAVPGGMRYEPTVNQAAVYLEGGYANCTDAAPSGDPLLDTGRAVFNGAGGTLAQVLRLVVRGRVGTIQLRRIKLTGGDAFNGSQELDNTGGGMMVIGAASVLLGRGAAISGNGAGRGAGVSLVGGLVNSGSTVNKVDLYLDEGAEIAGNSAAAEGGGIYCGGADQAGQPNTANNRHGSIIAIDGSISGNSASRGGAFWCYGSAEGGGGFQPRPRQGAAVLISGNQASVNCAAGSGSFDAALPAGGDGRRRLGAADGETGLLVIAQNSGKVPALCISDSATLGTTNATPIAQNRYLLQNLYISGQTGEKTLGLSLSGIDLRVQPSGVDTACSFFVPIPCVLFESSQASSQLGESPLLNGQSALAPASTRLEIVRGAIRDNLATQALVQLDAGTTMLIESTVIDGNRVRASTDMDPGRGSAAFHIRASSSSLLDLVHSTVLFATPLDHFVRLQSAGAKATVQASILASSASPAPANLAVYDGAATIAFTRKWCGFFQRSDDFASHTVVNDPASGTFTTIPAGSFSLGAGYVPGSLLVDRCTTSVQDDFYGRRFGSIVYYIDAGPADIGAVENRSDVIFADRFD